MFQPLKYRRLILLFCSLWFCLGGVAACQPPAPAAPSTTNVDSGGPESGSATSGDATKDSSAATRAASRLPTVRLRRDSALSPQALTAIQRSLSAGQQANFPVAEPADLLLSTEQPKTGQKDVKTFARILVPVDRFSTLLDGIDFSELKSGWSGNGATPDFKTLYAAEEALPDLIAILGPAGPAVKPLPAGKVSDALWSDHWGLGILPFDALTPGVRALRVNNLSITDRQLDVDRWPLASHIYARAATDAGRALLGKLPSGMLVINRDLERLTVLTMTGTTALTRGTAAAIESTGDPAFPARLVGPQLANSDITTVSNEVSFVDGCKADNRTGVYLFCSAPSYIATLELSGVKLVGLTGNHLNDFGTDAFLGTLDIYQNKGIQFYGGGVNDEAARAPLLLRNHGNTLAFIGANQFGPLNADTVDRKPTSAWATADSPGSAHFDRDQMAQAIAELRPKADVVLAELQYDEANAAGDYQTEPLPGQPEDFRALADAGADVVTGMQAHAPQAAELHGGRLILYGLGNLYFDQTWSWATRTGLVARHTIYDHRLINTELLVTVIDDNMQVRWATPEERKQVLISVFTASGW